MPRFSRFLLLPLASLLLPAAASAQVGSPLYTSVDPRGTALAGNGVAHGGDPAAWQSNPAAQGGAVGAGILWGNRTLPIFHQTMNHFMLGVWAGTPVGTFAVRFNKFDLGTYQQTFENGAMGSTFTSYEQMASFTYASPENGPITLGATVKWYEDNTTSVSPDSSSRGLRGDGTWFDLGAIFTASGLADDKEGHDTLRIGASVTNIGGKIRYGTMYSDEIRHWFRAGASYGMSFGTGENGVRAMASAEYRHLLNPYSDNGADVAGLGFEATVLELLTVRLGTTIQMFSDIYAEEGTPTLRYGLGVNVPMKRLGSDLPLSVGFDYGVEPLNSAIYSAGNSHVFGFSLRYTRPL